MTQIRKGDKVILKSGGPTMTVQDVGDYSLNPGFNPGVKCVWFDGNKPLEKVFDAEAVELYSEQP